MKRVTERLLRLTAAPRLAPAILMGAWMVAASTAADRPWAGALLGLLASATLLLAGRLPVLPLLSTVAGLMLADTADGLGTDDPWIALLALSMFCIGRFGGRRQQYLAGGAAALLVTMNIADRGIDTGVGDVAFPALFTLGPWLLGLSVQAAETRAKASAEHAAELLESSAAEVDRATAEERLRIARDLHDVVAHNISALSLLAQTSRRRAEAGDPVDVGDLRTIESVAQGAMHDLRQLLGVLRPARGIPVTGPHEGLAQLPELLALAERVGQEVTLQVSGHSRQLPPALSLAAYRILQEALANARRHAPGEPVAVVLTWREHELAITVSNPHTRPKATPSGSGTAGMAERARMFGGDVHAGSDGDAGWVVQGRLPLPTLQPELEPTP